MFCGLDLFGSPDIKTNVFKLFLSLFSKNLMVPFSIMVLWMHNDVKGVMSCSFFSAADVLKLVVWMHKLSLQEHHYISKISSPSTAMLMIHSSTWQCLLLPCFHFPFFFRDLSEACLTWTVSLTGPWHANGEHQSVRVVVWTFLIVQSLSSPAALSWKSQCLHRLETLLQLVTQALFSYCSRSRKKLLLSDLV